MIGFFDGLVQVAPFVTELLEQPTHARRQVKDRVVKDLRETLEQGAAPDGKGHTALQKKRAELIDHRGPTANQPRPDSMDGLEIELVRRFQGYEPHRRPLHRFSDRFGIQ
jgi:hypothetical protein